jgi:hypothetical protein
MRLQSKPVTIQLPRVNHNTLEVASEVEDGQTLIVGCMPTDQQPKHVYFLLTAMNVGK